MRVISLDQVTVPEVGPSEFVEIAAQAGYGAISTMLSGSPELPTVSLRAGDPDTVAMRRRLRDTGVYINVADGFPLIPDMPMDQMRAGIELMAEMGARKIVTLNFDPDAQRAFDSFCTLREWCNAAAMPLLIEFTPLSQIASLDDALRYRAEAGADGIEILVDFLHLNQSGGTPADVAALAPGVLGGAQLCDGLANLTMEEYFHSALYERIVPGEGEFPVSEFLAALPRDCVFGVEVPMRARAQAGVSALDRAVLLMDTTRALLGE